MPSSSFFLGEARCCLAGSVCDGLGGRGLHSSASLFSASGSHSSLSPWVGRGATRSWPGFLSLRSFLSAPESCFLWPDSWRLHGGGLRLGVTREANRPPFMPHRHRFGATCLSWIASYPRLESRARFRGGGCATLAVVVCTLELGGVGFGF